MSGQATGWVLRHGPKNRAQRAVLLTIADAANRDGEHAHPGLAAMIEGSLYSRSRVLAVIAELLADGWCEIEEEGGGRGRATVYRIPWVADGGPRNGPVAGPPTEGNRPEPEPKRSNPERETVQSSGSLPLSTTVATENPNTSASADVERLCDLLADRVAAQQDGRRPPVTDRWRKDMRLLLERGPLHQDTPETVAPVRVEHTIAYVFEHMAEPEGRSGFCWAAQIRSPQALRDHWHQMSDAAARARAARRGPSARAIDRVTRDDVGHPPTLFPAGAEPAAVRVSVDAAARAAARAAIGGAR